MGTNRRLSLTQCTAWSLVIGGHVLLILVFFSTRPVRMPEFISRIQSVLLLPDLAPVPASAATSGARRRRSSETRMREHPGPDTSDSSGITEAPPAEPSIDWRLEAERSAHAISAELARKEPKCDDSDRTWSLQPKCKKPKRPPEWELETPRAGFDRLIPYVRLGKRCILGLGFFGCAIGKLPEPNGHLFDDMNNPDRPRSSVPDVGE